jgi:hypothetical protein
MPRVESRVRYVEQVRAPNTHGDPMPSADPMPRRTPEVDATLCLRPTRRGDALHTATVRRLTSCVARQRSTLRTRFPILADSRDRQTVALNRLFAAMNICVRKA